ncbi:MAG: lipopolysaccharide assembly protein LapB [Pseudorhodobacter sp.]|nr:lipopolysaccharide assembly protein LapB [Rhizobacter sp.]
MGFDPSWLLLGLSAAFALGWLASRFDIRQWRREQRDSPKAYFKGLNFLLNEQQDKAIDAFIEAVQQDPDTSDLHFALGNLFRRRGDYERAVRVHEHLLSRADLPTSERQRAQHGLAQDYMKAGLFDRAEQAWRTLSGTPYDTEAQLALLNLHERSNDWRAAVQDAQALERDGAISYTGSYATRIAHYWCELAVEADAKGATADATEALRQAQASAPNAARALVMAGQRAQASGQNQQALTEWRKLLTAHPGSFGLVAVDFAKCAVACGAEANEVPRALTEINALYLQKPSLDLLAALAVLSPSPQAQHQRAAQHLAVWPSLSAAGELLRLRSAENSMAADPETAQIAAAIAQAAKPLQRYRCAACGFEAQRYFWHCPGCLNWDTYPPQRTEDLG